jgi:hypothetical protein
MHLHLKQSSALLRLTLLFGMIWSTAGRADSLTPSWGLSGGLEYFHLKEISSSGSRLLSESGERYVVTAILDNQDRYNLKTPFFYHLEAAAYSGEVNYDGQSQSVSTAQGNQPFRSHTDYEGGRAEAMLGYRVKPSMLPRAIDLLGGVGFDGWSRHIKDGTTANGTVVSGIKENYYVYYGKLALGMTELFPLSWHNHLQAGIKMPFRIDEDVNLRAAGYDNDISLSPGNTYSGFVRLVMEAPPAAGKTGNLLVSFYYDGTRFDHSPSKTVTQNGNPVQVWQPETHIDIFGVQVGYRF